MSQKQQPNQFGRFGMKR